VPLGFHKLAVFFLSPKWLRFGHVLLKQLSEHTGIPALLLAAALVAAGYRLLRRSIRFAAEVALVAFALFAASELGWLRW